jgi:penicillin-binding protein
MTRARHFSKKQPPIIPIIAAAVVIVAALIALLLIFVFKVGAPQVKQPDELLNTYFSGVKNKDYGSLYELIDESSQANISYEDFVVRNENIYSGIGATNI